MIAAATVVEPRVATRPTSRHSLGLVHLALFLVVCTRDWEIIEISLMDDDVGAGALGLDVLLLEIVGEVANDFGAQKFSSAEGMVKRAERRG